MAAVQQQQHAQQRQLLHHSLQLRAFDYNTLGFYSGKRTATEVLPWTNGGYGAGAGGVAGAPGARGDKVLQGNTAYPAATGAPNQSV